MKMPAFKSAEECEDAVDHADEEGNLLVWTDGGFDPARLVAGYGIFYGTGNPRNVAEPLEHGVPSAPRAERYQSNSFKRRMSRACQSLNQSQ